MTELDKAIIESLERRAAGPVNLAAALAELQTRLPDIKKSALAEVQTQKGAYSYSYAGLAQITQALMPLLGELGLSFIAKPAFRADRFVLACSLLHVSGEREDAEYPLPTTGTPQAIGSAITYGRRYTLCAMTGAAPEEDDDAASAEMEAQSQRGTAQRAARGQKAAAPTSGAGKPTAQRARPAAGRQPPLPGEPDGLTSAQRDKILAQFDALGVKDRVDRLALSSTIVNRGLGSANDLTKKEASRLIETLTEAEAAADPQAFLDEIRRLPIDSGPPTAEEG